MPPEAEERDRGCGSRDWSRFCRALSEPKQGSDLLYSGVVRSQNMKGGCKSQDRTSQNVGSLEEALDPTL